MTVGCRPCRERLSIIAIARNICFIDALLIRVHTKHLLDNPYQKGIHCLNVSEERRGPVKVGWQCASRDEANLDFSRELRDDFLLRSVLGKRIILRIVRQGFKFRPRLMDFKRRGASVSFSSFKLRMAE
jgi:hypothetical protein